MARPLQILVIEDNPADQRLTLEGLKRSSLRQASHLVADGEEAMSFLYQEGKYTDVKHPDLIILDLNLPKKDGREVLAEIKVDPDLKKIPVIVLSTSDANDDIQSCYDLGANCYLTKPADLIGYMDMVKGIQDFWLSLATLPSKQRNPLS